VKYWQTALLILATLFASLALAEDFKTVNGKEYKDATITRVESDGIVLKTKSGISKVYFTELPKDVQSRFHYNAEDAADLMKQADSALWNGQFGQGADLLNRIASEYPATPQAKTVRDVRSFLRDKGAPQDAPLTASEAEKLRRVMDALASIKKGYRTATPEKRQALETLLGAETFRDNDSGIASASSSGANLNDAVDKARQAEGTSTRSPATTDTNRPACLDTATAQPALNNAAESMDAAIKAAKIGDAGTAASHMQRAAASLRTAANAASADAAVSHPLRKAAEAYDKAAVEYARGDEVGASLYANAALGFMKASNDALQRSSVPRCHWGGPEKIATSKKSPAFAAEMAEKALIANGHMSAPRRVGASSSELLKATNYEDDEADNQHEPSERCPRDSRDQPRDHKERTHSFPHQRPALTTRTGAWWPWLARPLLVESGAPQLGHAAALSETSFPHSEHLISAIDLFPSFLKASSILRNFLAIRKDILSGHFIRRWVLCGVKSDQVGRAPRADLPMKTRVRSNQVKWEYSLGSDAIEALYQLS